MALFAEIENETTIYLSHLKIKQIQIKQQSVYRLRLLLQSHFIELTLHRSSLMIKVIEMQSLEHINQIILKRQQYSQCIC